MVILFRCDSSLLIGSGHLMRCLNLAELLKEAGHQIQFACRALQGNLINLAEEKQFLTHVLPFIEDHSFQPKDLYQKWLQVSLESEIAAFIDVQEIVKPDWVIVDHYSLGFKWEKAVASKGTKILAIDDLFRKHYCDAFIDHNYHDCHTDKIKVPSTSVNFLGPEYALLNQRFLKMCPSKTYPKTLKKVLVFFGGTDPEGITSQFLENISKIDSPSLTYEVVIGKNNPRLKEIQSVCSVNTNLNLHIQIDNMNELLNQCQLYIGSGGTITWERCYLGIPGICLAIAENQTELSQSLHESNIHTFLGHFENLNIDKLFIQINELINDHKKLQSFHESSLNLNVSSKLSKIQSFFN